MKNRERNRKLLITHRLHAQLSYHAKKEEKKNKTKFVDGGRDLSVGERALQRARGLELTSESESAVPVGKEWNTDVSADWAGRIK